MLVLQASRASTGKIIAAMMDDGNQRATLKYFVDDRWQPVLRAANPKYSDQPITPAHCIIGLYAGLTALRSLAYMSART